MANKSRRMSEQERDKRRRADRERLQRAAEELLSSEGWARWVRVRATFHSYSANNCMLLAAQCHERGIAPKRIAGFRAWLKLGRCVRGGETALRILAPVTVKQRDKHDDEARERRVFFKTAFVFELSQTEPLPGADPVPLEAPREPLTGDSHAHLLAPLRAFAGSLGYAVSFETIHGSGGGWCDAHTKRIVVDADVPANAQVRTLVPWRKVRIPTVGMPGCFGVGVAAASPSSSLCGLAEGWSPRPAGVGLACRACSCDRRRGAGARGRR